MKKLLKEFRDFALKGNMFDLAVGVIHRRCIQRSRLLPGKQYYYAGAYSDHRKN